MPVASDKNNGLVSAQMAEILIPMVGIATTDTKTIIKIEVYGKINFLCGSIKNGFSPFIFCIQRQYSFFNVTKISGNIDLKFAYKDEGANIWLIYITGIGAWGDFSAIPFNGKVNSMELLTEVPEDAIPISIS